MSDLKMVRIISQELAKISGMSTNPSIVYEAWPLQKSGENSWMDEDGRPYDYEVMSYDDVEDDDGPPVGWLAFADQVEVVTCDSCGKDARASVTKSGVEVWKCFECLENLLRGITTDERMN